MPIGQDRGRASLVRRNAGSATNGNRPGRHIAHLAGGKSALCAAFSARHVGMQIVEGSCVAALLSVCKAAHVVHWARPGHAEAWPMGERPAPEAQQISIGSAPLRSALPPAFPGRRGHPFLVAQASSQESRNKSVPHDRTDEPPPGGRGPVTGTVIRAHVSTYLPKSNPLGAHHPRRATTCSVPLARYICQLISGAKSATRRQPAGDAIYCGNCFRASIRRSSSSVVL
jgi:hypothetical protein